MIFADQRSQREIDCFSTCVRNAYLTQEVKFLLKNFGVVFLRYLDPLCSFPKEDSEDSVNKKNVSLECHEEKKSISWSNSV